MSFSTEQQQITDLVNVAIRESDYGLGYDGKYDTNHDISFGDIVRDINDEGRRLGYVSGLSDDGFRSEHVDEAPCVRVSYIDGSRAWVKYDELQLVSEADPKCGISRSLDGGTLFCPLCGEQCHGSTCVMADEDTGLCYIGYVADVISNMFGGCLNMTVKIDGRKHEVFIPNVLDSGY